jgi:hypothetical protein
MYAKIFKITQGILMLFLLTCRVIQEEGLCIYNIHNTYMHTYHSRFILEGVAEASQIFLREAHVLPKLLSYE